MWKFLLYPLVGSVIGYVTNWIAVKMLFYPHHEVRVFGKKLPFTPGVIPKGQPRLARAAGDVIEKHLLTEETIRNMLLSDEMHDKCMEGVRAWKERSENSETTVRDLAVSALPADQLDDIIFYAENDITDYICAKIMEMDPGAFIMEKVMEEARAKLSESMFGMMIGSSMIEKLGDQIKERIDDYLDCHLHEYVEDMVLSESARLQEAKITDIVAVAESKGEDSEELFWTFFTGIISDKLPEILKTIRFSRIVENRINDMDIAEVEDLVFYIMEKELNAIVSLGAVIGFILGLGNLALAVFI